MSFAHTATRRYGSRLNDAASVGRDESGIRNVLSFRTGQHRTIDHDDTVLVRHRIAITNVTNRVETATCFNRFLLDDGADVLPNESCVTSSLYFFTTGEQNTIDQHDCVRVFNRRTWTNVTRRRIRYRAGEDWWRGYANTLSLEMNI
jgi:hypothetical protein